MHERQPFGAIRVRDVQGRAVSLAPNAQPTVVMINSRTCPWCKRALKDIGELSAGRAVPRLVVLTLEGAADGVPMLAQEGITGARLVGPLGPTERDLLLQRYRGTPTFLALDRQGQITHTMPGYPIRPIMEQWFAVMTGDADSP
jgi:thioredoxin-related protein